MAASSLALAVSLLAAPVPPVPTVPLVTVQAVTTAPAEETRFTAGSMEILSPWSRATQPGRRSAPSISC